MKFEKIPATLFRATVYFADVNHRYKNADEFAMELIGDAFGVETAPLMWHDEIDINYSHTTEDDYAKYFKLNQMTKEEIERELGYKIEIIDD